MNTYILVENEWVEGEPVDGQKFKKVNSKGGELVSYWQTPQQPVIRNITVGAFRLRFTLPEKVAIETSTDPVVKVLQADLNASKYIDLDNTALLQGLDYYVTAGILAGQPRIDELTTNGTQQEAY